MSEHSLNPTVNKKAVFTSLLYSCLIILFLFYIDEGYYNFQWMKQTGNWIVFGLYLAIFSLGQLITHRLILKPYKGGHKTTLTSVIGIPLGFGLILLVFYLLHFRF